MTTMDIGSPSRIVAGDDVADLALIEVLSPRYAPILGEKFVDVTVREALADVRADARIQQFVPLIAHRIASDRLCRAEQALAEHGDQRD